MLRNGVYRAVIGGVVLAATLGLSGCASRGAVATAPAGPVVPPPSLDTKVGWLLRLEQQRVLRDAPAVAPEAETAEAAGTAAVVERPAGFHHAMTPDLVALIGDPDPIVRARAAVAIGRVGMAEGVAPLVAALSDPVEDVRGQAAFGLGLLGARDAVSPLETALADPSVAVRGRAIEALGLIGDARVATAIAQAADGCPALLAGIEPDDEAWPQTPEIEVCRQSLYALVRLGDFDALARVALDAQGQPVSRWWPVAYALQRSGDRRALVALRSLANVPGVYTASFALRGLTALGDPEALPRARALAVDNSVDVKLRVAAVRLLGHSGTADDVARLTTLLSQVPSSSPLAIEAVAAIGTLPPAPGTFDLLIDAFSDPAPAMRAAAYAAAARLDPDAFLLVLSGLGRDRDWSVRAALATVLGTLPADRVTPALVDLTADDDARVHGSALRALAAVKVPDLAERLRVALEAADFAERATAADLVGVARIDGGATLLAAAFTRGVSDSTYAARLAAIEALAPYGEAGVDTWRQALADREWPVRVRAAALLRAAGVADAEPERPAPLRRPASFFTSDALLHPSYSPRAFIETRRGVIEVQLELMDAPLTVATFVEQVRSGLFNGLPVHRVVPGFVVQTGDPRGDGAGGPGYTQRDEFSSTPFLRGTIGMALGGAETAGSQWFITTSPQPHLDAKYTAFGRVVGGWDVLDQVAAHDVIERVRIWDGIDLR